MNIAGIDPGKTGAIVIIFVKTQAVLFSDMPVIAKAIDPYEIASMLEANQVDRCVIEKQQPYPKQGGKSNFTTGYNYGLLCGILSTMKIPYLEAHPKTWHRKVGVLTNKDVPIKTVVYQVASRLYPKQVGFLKTPRGKINDGKCDALLLAHYGLIYWGREHGIRSGKVKVA